MGLKIQYIEGQTPLDEDEAQELLIETITTRGELDEFEQLNIQNAIKWSIKRKFKKEEILKDEFVRELHRQMFGDVWKWAGTFRKTNKNIGIDWTLISTSLKELNDNCLHWINEKIFSEEEIAIHYKHKLVSIHCFPNGNGRHSRIMADIIISHIFGQEVFSWNETDIGKNGDARNNYLISLREADKGDIKSLLSFAKS